MPWGDFGGGTSTGSGPHGGGGHGVGAGIGGDKTGGGLGGYGGGTGNRGGHGGNNTSNFGGNGGYGGGGYGGGRNDRGGKDGNYREKDSLGPGISLGQSVGGPQAPNRGGRFIGPPTPSIGNGLHGPPTPGTDPGRPDREGRDYGTPARTLTHEEQVRRGLAAPFGTSQEDQAAYKAYQTEQRARDKQAAAARDAGFVGPREQSFFGRIGSLLGFDDDLAAGDFEQDRPTEERALQRAIFKEAAAVPATEKALQQRVSATGSGYVTAEEADQLGGFARTAAQVRASGGTVDAATGEVTSTGGGFLGLGDLSKAIGTLTGIDDYSLDISTFAGKDRAQQRAITSGIRKGTITAADTEEGYKTSAIGVLGEVASLGFDLQSLAKTASAATSAVGILGFTGPALPAVGAAALAGYTAFGAVQDLFSLAEEQQTLGLTPSKPSGGPSRSPTGGGDGEGGNLPPFFAPITGGGSPTTPLVPTPEIPTLSPRRPARGAGLGSTIRTSLYGDYIPTIRRVR